MERASKEQIQQMQEAGLPLPLYRLGLAMEGCATEQEMNANFFATLERGYKPINPLIGAARGVCSVVGAGPTIEQTHTELKGDVLAINSAIGYLLNKGITPKWAMIWDAAEICKNFAIPNPDIHYLVASRCHPAVFEALKNCRVTVWHAAGDNNILEILQRPEVIAKQPCHEPLINGGTAGVTRAIFLATVLGYKEVHMYGADSCYSSDGATHVNGSLVPEKDVQVAIGNDPPIFFRTTPEWCAQVEEYRTIYTVLTCCGPGIKLEVHGEGMLKTMHDILTAQLELMGPLKFVQHNAKLEEEKNNIYAQASADHEASKVAA